MQPRAAASPTHIRARAATQHRQPAAESALTAAVAPSPRSGSAVEEAEEGDEEEGPVEHPAAPAAASRGTAALLSNDVVLSAILTKLSSPFGALAARAATGSTADSAAGAVPFGAKEEEEEEEEGKRGAAQQAAAPSKRPSVGEALRVDAKAWMIKFQDLGGCLLLQGYHSPFSLPMPRCYSVWVHHPVCKCSTCPGHACAQLPLHPAAQQPPPCCARCPELDYLVGEGSFGRVSASKSANFPLV